METLNWAMTRIFHLLCVCECVGGSGLGWHPEEGQLLIRPSGREDCLYAGTAAQLTEHGTHLTAQVEMTWCVWATLRARVCTWGVREGQSDSLKPELKAACSHPQVSMLPFGNPANNQWRVCKIISWESDAMLWGWQMNNATLRMS